MLEIVGISSTQLTQTCKIVFIAVPDSPKVVIGWSDCAHQTVYSDEFKNMLFHGWIPMKHCVILCDLRTDLNWPIRQLILARVCTCGVGTLQLTKFLPLFLLLFLSGPHPSLQWGWSVLKFKLVSQRRQTIGITFIESIRCQRPRYTLTVGLRGAFSKRTIKLLSKCDKCASNTPQWLGHYRWNSTVLCHRSAAKTSRVMQRFAKLLYFQDDWHQDHQILASSSIIF